MKATGIVRPIDTLGRIVIPMEIRRMLQLRTGEPMEIYTTDDGIVLRPLLLYPPHCARCACCGAEKALARVAGIALCPACVQAFQREAAQAGE